MLRNHSHMLPSNASSTAVRQNGTLQKRQCGQQFLSQLRPDSNLEPATAFQSKFLQARSTCVAAWFLRLAFCVYTQISCVYLQMKHQDHFVPDDPRRDPLLFFFSARHPPAGSHAVGLAGPCLSVRKDSSIVSTEAALHQLRDTVAVHLLL